MAFQQEHSVSICDSLLSGSQEAFDFFCEPCDLESRHIEAKGYCTKCEQFLCLDCCSSHRKPIPTRHHILLDEHQMPKDMPPTPSVSKCTEKCPIHPGELVQLFCNRHNQIGCNKCMSVDHYRCNDVHYIPSFAKGVAESRNFLLFSERLDKLEKSVNLSENTNKTKVFQINKNYKDVNDDIETFRKDMNIYLDKLERKLRLDAVKEQNDKMKVVEQNSKACEEVKYKISTLRSQLKVMKKSNLETELFMSMVKKETELRLLEKIQEVTKTNLDISPFTFIPDEMLMDPWEGIIRLGLVLETPIKRNISKVKNIEVKLPIEQKWVEGIVAISEQHLAYFDGTSSLIQVLNTETEKVDSELDLKVQPFGITSISDCTIAVSLPENKEIVVLSIHKNAQHSVSLSKNKSIFVNEICKGIVYSQKRFVVACSQKVLLIDMNGNELKCFGNNKSGDSLFTSAMYVAVSADNKYIYVSEKDGTVTQLSFESPIFKTRLAKESSGITTDTFGNVYVAGWSDNNIVKATAHLNSIEYIPSGMFYYASITYLASSDKLFVGTYNGIEVFTID